MVTYDPSSTVGDARALYFETNGFGADGGYGERWVPVKLGPAEFLIRNTKGRVRSVRLHDLHHIATGYATDLEGEALIAAWELGAGCHDHYAAWFLNTSAFAFGLVLAPRELWRAFVRGRRGRTLYRGEWDEALLGRTVGDLREELGTEGPHAGRAADALLFSVLVAAGVYTLVWSVALAPLFAVATVHYRLARAAK
jgi:hypothetical protein